MPEDQEETPEEPLPQLKKDKLGMAFAVLAMGGIVVLTMLLAVAFMAIYKGEPGSGTGARSGYNCSGVTSISITTDEFGWVNDSAGKYLRGDEAALIALIQIESGWREDAKAPGSSAAGLGQFVTSTARGWPEFVGGDDKHGIVWPGGTIYDNPSANPDDARFDPKRSIYAAAHKLQGHLEAENWSLREAYIEGYHSYCRDLSNQTCVNQKNEAIAGAERLMNEYNKLIQNGGCSKVTATACGVIPVEMTNIQVYSANTKLMPPAAENFNKMAADFKSRTGVPLKIESMFRTRAEQIAICGQVIDGRCSNPNANPPGTSLHEAGLAFDTKLSGTNGHTQEQYEILKSISSTYKWEVTNPNYGASESWHFDYIGLKPQYWYGEPYVTNAINAANGINCSTTTVRKEGEDVHI